jgi:hypothetical protein
MSSPDSGGAEPTNPLLAMLLEYPLTTSIADKLYNILSEVYVTTVNDVKGYSLKGSNQDELETYVYNTVFKHVDATDGQKSSLALKFSGFLWDCFRKEEAGRRAGKPIEC